MARTAHVLRLRAGVAARATGAHRRHHIDVLHQVGDAAVEHRRLALATGPGCTLDAQLQVVGHLGLEVGVGQRRAHAGRVAVLDGGKARFVRGNGIGLAAVVIEQAGQLDQAIGGAG